MNRLSPLIVRRVGRFAPSAALPAAMEGYYRASEAASASDIEQFVTTFLAGLVFFVTYLA
ncbi:MAG: hypothetical protein M3N07_01180 [Pseudomonadota bacterium]|nr:hypothetical protein [Pseudomonadota bacterium]